MAGVCERECMRRSQGDEPLTLTRYNSEMSQPYEALGGKTSVCGQADNLRAYRGNVLFYLLSLLILMRADPAVAGAG